MPCSSLKAPAIRRSNPLNPRRLVHLKPLLRRRFFFVPHPSPGRAPGLPVNPNLTARPGENLAESPTYNAPDWSNVHRLLVIMAHPDDPDFTCAGTAIQMARQGIEVTYMILTNGDKGNHNPEVTRNQLIAMRKIEQRAAAELCGVKQVLFMGEEDGFLRPTLELRERVTREIRRIRA